MLSGKGTRRAISMSCSSNKSRIVRRCCSAQRHNSESRSVLEVKIRYRVEFFSHCLISDKLCIPNALRATSNRITQPLPSKPKRLEHTCRQRGQRLGLDRVQDRANRNRSYSLRTSLLGDWTTLNLLDGQLYFASSPRQPTHACCVS